MRKRFLSVITIFSLLGLSSCTGVSGPKYYSVRWVDHDGTLLELDEKVKEGEMPSYDSATPTRAADEHYSYAFKGWSPEVAVVSKDVTYTATYTQTTQKYTVRWVNYNDAELEVQTNVPYGTIPIYPGTTDPSKPSTTEKSYNFTGWDPAPAAITGDVTYKAQFEEVARKYTITWVDENEEPLETSQVAYGTVPEYPGEYDPSKASTEDYNYYFAGWDPVPVAVTGEATYTATYAAKRKYTITWNDDEGHLLETSKAEEGTIPTYPGAQDPSKEPTAQYTYTFTGWDPVPVAVTGEATYAATFSSEVNKYTIRWVDDEGAELEVDENVEYGTTPSFDGSTDKPDSELYHYTFTGWDPAVEDVTGNQTYTATYDKTSLYENSSAALLTDNGRISETYTTAKTYQKNTSTKADYFSQVGWTVSYGTKSDADATKFQMGNCTHPDYGYHGDLTPAQSTMAAETDQTTDTYKIAAAVGSAETTHLVSAIWSDTYFEGLNDVHFYWRDCETAGYVRMVYQIKGEDEWKVLKRDDGEGAAAALSGYAPDGKNTASGTSGDFNHYSYENYLTYGSSLKNRAVRIGFVYTVYNSQSTTYYMNLGGIVINAAQEAINFANRIGANYADYSANWQYKNTLRIIYNSIAPFEDELKDTEITVFDVEDTNYYDFLTTVKAAWNI